MAPFSPCPPCHPPPPTATHYPHLVQPLPSPLPAMSDLHDLSAHALMAAYRQRQLSPVEVTQAVLSHIARWEPHLQATYLLRPEAALAQARASEARWLRGAPLSALDGVPGSARWGGAPKKKKNPPRPGPPRPGGPRRPPPPPLPLPPMRPRPRACARPGPSSLPRPRCPTTACCPRACRACTRSRATRGIWPKAPAAPAPAAGRLRPQAMARCTSAPTSAARCACPPVGAASSASSPAWAASLSTRPTPAAPPAR